MPRYLLLPLDGGILGEARLMMLTATRRFTYHTRQPYKLDCKRVKQPWKWAVVNYPTGEISRN